MKKITAIAITLALVIALFAGCGAETPPPMDPPHDILVPVPLEPIEPDLPGAAIDYWAFITSLGYLLDGRTWAAPIDIDPESLIMWYVAYAQIRPADTYGDNESGYLTVPAENLERTIYQYFGLEASRFRSAIDTGVFDSDNKVYILANPIPEVIQSILLTRVEEMIGEPGLILNFSVTINQETADFILEVYRNDDDTFRFISLADGDGAFGRDAVLTR